MAAAPTRSYRPAQKRPQAAALGLSVLAAISEAISPSEAAVLVQPLKEVAASFVAPGSGSLFSEWAPPRQSAQVDIPMHRAHAFASSSKSKDDLAALAALSADMSTSWVSEKSQDPKLWTVRLGEPITGPATVVIQLSTDDSAVIPSSVLVQTSTDGLKFVAAGDAVMLKADDEADKESASAAEAVDVFAPPVAADADEGDADIVRVTIPSGRRAAFVRVKLSGNKAEPSSETPTASSIARVSITRPDTSPFARQSGFALDTILGACTVAGDASAPAAARAAAIEAAIAVAAATSSARAATLALRLATVHLAGGGTTLPGTVSASLRSIAAATASAAAEARGLAQASGAAPQLADVIKSMPSGDAGQSMEPKFDSRHHGSNCTIEAGGRVWKSTGGSDNYGMAKHGVKKGTATWEFEIIRDNRDDEHGLVGFCIRPVNSSSYTSTSDMWMVRGYNGCRYHGGSQSNVGKIHEGDVVKFRANMSRGVVDMWINGTKQGDGEPVFTDLRGKTIYPAVCAYSGDVTIKLKSYSSAESTGESGGGAPVAAASHTALLSAVAEADGVSAPGLVKTDGDAKLTPVAIDGVARKDVIIFSPAAGPTAASASASAAAAAPSLSFSVARAVGSLKKKLPADLVPRLFVANFSIAPGSPPAATAAAAFVDVLVDGEVAWRSGLLHANPAVAGASAGPFVCRVPVSEASKVVVRAFGRGSSDACTAVAMVGPGIAVGTKGLDLADAIALPGRALAAEWTPALGELVTPALTMGGGVNGSGFEVTAVPTAQVVIEMACCLREALRAESALTTAAVQVVGVGGRKVTAGASDSSEASKDEEEEEEDSGGKDIQKALTAALSRLETRCGITASDGAIMEAAKALRAVRDAASAGDTMLPVVSAVAGVLVEQAAVLLSRIEASGIPAAGLGIALPGKGSAASGAAASAASSRVVPLSALRFELAALGSDISEVPSVSARALSAIDAGIPIFYPTKALRRALMASLLDAGATLELQIRFPTLSEGAVAMAFGEKGEKTHARAVKALVDRPAEAHPSLRDARFDRALLLVQAAAREAGYKTRVAGAWGGWMHLLVSLPPSGTGSRSSVDFIGKTMRSCLKRAGMGPWHFPGGCSLPAIALEVHRSTDVPAAERGLTKPGTAVVRVFPTAAGSFDDVGATLQAAVDDFVAKTKAGASA